MEGKNVDGTISGPSARHASSSFRPLSTRAAPMEVLRKILLPLASTLSAAASAYAACTLLELSKRTSFASLIKDQAEAQNQVAIIYKWKNMHKSDYQYVWAEDKSRTSSSPSALDVTSSLNRVKAHLETALYYEDQNMLDKEWVMDYLVQRAHNYQQLCEPLDVAGFPGDPAEYLKGNNRPAVWRRTDALKAKFPSAYS